PPQDRIDALHESAHSVMSLGHRAVQPCDISIRTSYIAVRAGRDLYDNFPAPLHGWTVSSNVANLRYMRGSNRLNSACRNLLFRVRSINSISHGCSGFVQMQSAITSDVIACWWSLAF